MRDNEGLLVGGVNGKNGRYDMAGYHVSFFKNLLSSDGHCFACLQQELDVRDSKSAAEAVECASRTFEAQHGVPDWRLLADRVEVTAV